MLETIKHTFFCKITNCKAIFLKNAIGRKTGALSFLFCEKGKASLKVNYELTNCFTYGKIKK